MYTYIVGIDDWTVLNLHKHHGQDAYRKAIVGKWATKHFYFVCEAYVARNGRRRWFYGILYIVPNLVELNFWEYPAKWGYDIRFILTS